MCIYNIFRISTKKVGDYNTHTFYKLSHVLIGSVTVSSSKICKSCIRMFTFNKVFLKGLVETCNAYTILISFRWYEDIFHVLTKVGDVRTWYSVWTRCSYIVLVIYVLSLVSVLKPISKCTFRIKCWEVKTKIIHQGLKNFIYFGYLRTVIC